MLIMILRKAQSVLFHNICLQSVLAAVLTMQVIVFIR